MSPKLILHIDDDDDDLQILREAIETNESFLLKQYSNGKDGLLFLEEAKVLGNVPCLIILDMNMRVMNGKDVVLQIKNDTALSHVTVIIFTTTTGFSDLEFCRKHAVTVLVKPYTINEYDVIVQKILTYAA
ncbi:MAG TPA: response regulator [Flavisolibacter sp.]|jgi:CheY-like chemotaxis protein|nr:response regulator [Flavisolibacter sp.]